MNKKDQTNKNIIIAGIGFFAIVIAIIAVINLFIPSSHAQVPASFANFDQQASFASFDQQASFANFDQQASFANFDQQASFANFDQQASFANFDQQASFANFNQFDYSPTFNRGNAFANDFNFAFNNKFAFDKNARS